MNEFCSHPEVRKSEETTKGFLPKTDFNGPIPDLVNIFTYKCLLCGATLEGRFRAKP